MICYACKQECVKIGAYDGMYPSCSRCPKCGSIYDGDGDWIEG